MNTCYIVGAGEFYGGFTPDGSDLVIAADGGYTALTDSGIRCDLLIGDLDSIPAVPKDVEILRYPCEKDETDMYLAYREGAKRGYRKFEIYGGVGGRSDHTYANYCLLATISSDGCAATLYGRGDKAYIVQNEAARVTGGIGKGISVFAFGKAAAGVTLRGLYYTLDGYTLTPHNALGVSNKFASDTAEISVKDGVLLIIQEI